MSADVLVRRARFPSFPDANVPAAPSPPPTPLPADEATLAREVARREGLVQGRAEGRAAAVAEWAPRLTALAAALEETIAVLRAERTRLAATIAETMPLVAIELARKVIERELTTGEEAVRAAVEPVVRRLAQTGGAGLRVAPDVAETLQAWRGDGDAPAALAGVTIRADESLRRGDWVIETDGGFLDGRLVTKFEEAARILTEPEA